jgi:hypothetical protein
MKSSASIHVEEWLNMITLRTSLNITHHLRRQKKVEAMGRKLYCFGLGFEFRALVRSLRGTWVLE